jgi:hypothetical protein
MNSNQLVKYALCYLGCSEALYPRVLRWFYGVSCIALHSTLCNNVARLGQRYTVIRLDSATHIDKLASVSFLVIGYLYLRLTIHDPMITDMKLRGMALYEGASFNTAYVERR